MADDSRGWEFLTGFLLGSMVGAAAALLSLWMPFAGFRGEAFVDIPKGSGTRAIARLLNSRR